MNAFAFLLRNPRSPISRAGSRAGLAGCAAALGLAAWSPGSAPPAAASDPCEKVAGAALRSCRLAAFADYWLEVGKCENLSDPIDRAECRMDALDGLDEAREECDDQFDARVDLCDALGGGFYDPEIDPQDFVAVVDNPYFPLIPGRTLVYEKMTPEGLERVRVTTTHDTIEILGVTCTVVRDVETLDDEVIEDTLDWFAQDVQGNVWYFGEISREYEDGRLVSLDGSWKAGEDGAMPGIIMLAAPAVGDVYRQEFYLGEAEDAAAVIATGQGVSVAYGAFTDCVVTEDFTPLEPGNLEEKSYAPGIGLIAELDPSSGERLELIDVIYP
jgi:hypothetical protein